MRRIYLDYAATTPVAAEVLAAMRPYFSSRYGNPGSLHSFGQEALAAVDRARETVARFVNADFREVVFTGSATEANNLALRGAARGPKRPRMIVSAVEHESILETARDLEGKGVEVVEVPVDGEGVVDMKKLKAALNDRTVLVSVMYINNEIGVVQPIGEIADLVGKFRRRGASTPIYPLFHTDASQAPDYFDCDIKKLGADLMTLSSQKIYGPKGVGALCGEVERLAPLITGGGQEFGLRSGTENVAGIVGFAEAMDIAAAERRQAAGHVAELKDHFWKNLKRIVPGVEVNGRSDAPHILNVYFPEAYAGDLLVQMDMAGIAASSGSACSARAFTPSHVLQAIGLAGERIRGSVRFSFGRPTTKRELDGALKKIKAILV